MTNVFRIIGCSPDYVPECFMGSSDEYVCPASACLENEKFFPCADKKYCIKAYHVCDGYAQCEDASGMFLMELPIG